VLLVSTSTPGRPSHRGRGPRSWFLVLSACLLGACTGAPAVLPAPDPDDPQYREWRVYHGDKEGTQYSSLSQINVGNVHRLEVAWIFSTGDRGERRTEMQCSPIVVDGILYCSSPELRVFAIEGDTGELLWMYDPFERLGARSPHVNRGVVYWDDGGDDRRIFFVAGQMIHSVDVSTGAPIEEFGRRGMVDLKEGLGRDVADLFVSATSPGIIYGDLLIQGTRVAETLPAAPGHIRAYDVRTGSLVWTFRTIPHPGEYGHETWPAEAYRYLGGANNWAGMSLDEERGIVYVPTGSPTFDFYGGNRLGENLFGNSLIALDAATGERLWHFQMVRHDLFDYDLPMPPNLLRVRRNGRTVDAVAQVTKTGHIFVFDRVTGEPLFPIRDVEVPGSDLIGEEAWPTQPIPVLPAPFARQTFTEDLVTDLSPESRAAVLERFRQMRGQEIFTPPSVEGTIVFPGFHGGAEWGGAAVDPATGVIYVNSSEMPWTVTMMGVPGADADPSSQGRRVYTLNCASCHGADLEGDARGVFPRLADLPRRMPRDEVAAIIERGRGFMPGFAHIPGDEKEALIAYLMDPQRRQAEEEPGAIVDVSDPTRVPYAHTGWFRFLDPDGYPAVKPPWGTLNAIDLNTGEYLWRVPLGEFPELTARGIPQTGTENYGGPMVTAGGLVFIAATQDEKFRAFDKRTGQLLWETDLPAGGYATPATYEIGGKQYIVIAAGGGKMGTKSSDTYVAFALPD
jgi:quinoprotein glucose dehydrogenase